MCCAVAGLVTRLAGSTGTVFADGQGTQATFNNPFGLVTTTVGNIVVSDFGNNAIRQITSSGSQISLNNFHVVLNSDDPVGLVTTLSGSVVGFADGTYAASTFASPIYITVTTSLTFYVADYTYGLIRQMASGNSFSNISKIV
jgi:hypothetical protein